MIDTRVFVLFELGQLVLADVDHGCEVSEERDEMLRSLLLLLLFCVREKHEVAKWRVLACDCGNDPSCVTEAGPKRKTLETTNVARTCQQRGSSHRR